MIRHAAIVFLAALFGIRFRVPAAEAPWYTRSRRQSFSGVGDSTR